MQPQRSRRTGARRLTLEGIVAAAAAVIASEGFEALTMRRIAEECGVGVMTLYGYVRTKEEILAALSDRLLGEVELPATTDGPWTEQVAAVFRSVHRVFSAHPELAQIATTQPIDGLAAYRGAELVLAALRGAGFDDEVAFCAFDALVCYTAGFTQRQIAFEAPTVPSANRLRRIHQLPPDEFPSLVALAPLFVSPRLDERFDEGLALLIDGLARRLEHRRRPEGLRRGHRR
jgi:AcrR family transcriptional regulator